MKPHWSWAMKQTLMSVGESMEVREYNDIVIKSLPWGRGTFPTPTLDETLVYLIQYLVIPSICFIVELANNLNDPEGFLIQARNGTEDTSEIVGTFLDPDVVRACKGPSCSNQL